MLSFSPFSLKDDPMILIAALCSALGIQDPAPSVDDALKAFKEAYKIKDPATRTEAVGALGKVQHPKTLKVLHQVLVSGQPPIRQKAAEVLGTWTSYSDRAVVVLRAGLKPNDKLLDVHVAIVTALGSLKALSALKEIHARLDHVKMEVSVAAIKTAEKLASPLSVEKLVAMVERIENIRNQPPRLGGGFDATRSSPELRAKRRAQYPLLLAALNAITRQKFKDGKEVLTWWKDNRRTYRRR